MDCDECTTGFVIKLKDNAPLNLPSIFESIRKSGNIIVSYSATEHTIEMPEILDKALFISFDAFKFDEQDEIVFYSLLYKIAKKFGVPYRDPKTGTNFPCIHEEVDVLLFLIKSSQWLDKYDDDYLIETATGRVLTPDECDDVDDNYDEDDENDASYDPFTRICYIDITDTNKYEETEPFFFLSKIFWRKRKAKYEVLTKESLIEVDKLWQKVRY